MIDENVLRAKVIEVLDTLKRIYPDAMTGSWVCKTSKVRFHWSYRGMSYSFNWWGHPHSLYGLGAEQLVLVMEQLPNLARFVEKRDLKLQPVPSIPTKQDIEFQQRVEDAVRQANQIIVWWSNK